jgi:hypothetical protein
VNIVHYMKKEKSGLAFTTLELVQAEERLGHRVLLREPTDDTGMPGTVLYGDPSVVADVECVHSQMPVTANFSNVPKFLFCHGEPLSSVGNGVSMKAMVDMAPKIDAFIAMRQEEAAIWRTLKRTYVVPKGIDLERFKPLDVPAHVQGDDTTKLSGSPSILYCEHWRGQRNPLYWCVAMEQVWKVFPQARLHLFNCPGGKMFDTFRSLINHNKWTTFIRTLNGPVDDAQVNFLYNRADITVSGLYPLYARSIEAFGAGKAFIGAGYTDPEYPWHCDYHPDSMAKAIIDCWTDYGRIDYRQWAEQKHDVMNTVRKLTDIFQGYLQ